MPTSSPVVKGICSSPAKRNVSRRRCGSLSGARRCAAQVGERLDHHALGRRDRAQLGEFVAIERAGVGVGEESGALEHHLRALAT